MGGPLPIRYLTKNPNKLALDRSQTPEVARPLAKGAPNLVFSKINCNKGTAISTKETVLNLE